MKLSCVNTFLIVLILGYTSTADASLIVGTDVEGNGGYGVGFSFDPNVNLIIAQQFTLNQPVVADSVTVYLNGDGTNNPQGGFTLQVMDAIGPGANPADILSTQSGLFPSGPLPTAHAPVTFSGLNLPLGAGNYYLVVSSEAGPGTGWGSGGNALPGGVGSLGSAFVGIALGGGVADFTFLDLNNPQSSNANFRIDAVPEPAGVSLLISGFTLLLVSRVVARRESNSANGRKLKAKSRQRAAYLVAEWQTR